MQLETVDLPEGTQSMKDTGSPCYRTCNMTDTRVMDVSLETSLHR